MAKKTKQAKQNKNETKHNYKGEFVLIFQNGNQCQRHHAHFPKKARVPNISPTRPVSEVWFSLPSLSMVGKRIYPTCHPKTFEEQVLFCFFCHTQSTCGRVKGCGDIEKYMCNYMQIRPPTKVFFPLDGK